MKFLKGFFTFILSVVLFFLIFALSLIFQTKHFVEQDLVVTTVKETIISQLSESELTYEQQKLVDSLIKDKDSDKIIKRIVQNFISYKTTENYEVSKEDYNLLVNFIVKHKDDFNTMSNTNYTEAEIREQLKYEDLKVAAKETFKSFEEEAATDSLQDVLNVYTETTSTNNLLTILGTILAVITLICLINWSLITWMIAAGVDLIISGILTGSLFGFINAAKSYIQGDEVAIRFSNSINFNGFIYMAIAEIALGILLIVAYSKLKKKQKEETVI